MVSTILVRKLDINITEEETHWIKYMILEEEEDDDEYSYNDT